jgi:hypothetical protein
MKFYKLTDAPLRKDDQVFKVSPTGSLIATSMLFSIVIMLVVLGFCGGRKGGVSFPPSVPWLIAAAVLALFALLALGSLRASLKPSNWLLRCKQKGLLIKYRSHRNWRLPAEDVQVVGLEYSEIACAWQVKEWRNTPGLDGGARREMMTYLNLRLVDPDTALLEQHLEAERKRQWSSLLLHYPVEVLPGGIIRLQWRRAGGGLYSNPARAINWLSQHVKIAPPSSSKTDLTHQPGASPVEEEGKILQLLKSGDKMGAVRLTREVYNCSLSEAMTYVDKMNE